MRMNSSKAKFYLSFALLCALSTSSWAKGPPSCSNILKEIYAELNQPTLINMKTQLESGTEFPLPKRGEIRNAQTRSTLELIQKSLKDEISKEAIAQVLDELIESKVAEGQRKEVVREKRAKVSTLRGKKFISFKYHQDIAAVSADRKWIAYHASRNPMVVINLKTHQELELQWDSNFYGYDDISFSPDGKHIAATVRGTYANYKVFVWSVETGKLLYRVNGRNVSFIPNSNDFLVESTSLGRSVLSIYSLTKRSPIMLWLKPKLKKSIKVKEARPLIVDDKIITNGDFDKVLRDGRSVHEAFSKDGTFYAAYYSSSIGVAHPQFVVVWNLKTGEVINTINFKKEVEGFESGSGIFGIYFYGPNNSLLIGGTKEIFVWNSKTNEKEFQLKPKSATYWLQILYFRQLDAFVAIESGLPWSATSSSSPSKPVKAYIQKFGSPLIRLPFAKSKKWRISTPDGKHLLWYNDSTAQYETKNIETTLDEELN